MAVSEYTQHPEHVRWALKRWEQATGRRVDEPTAMMIEEILLEHRQILAEQVQKINMGEAYTSRNGFHERDIAAEKLGRSVVLTCAAMVSGKFGLVPRKTTQGGRPIEDVVPGL